MTPGQEGLSPSREARRNARCRFLRVRERATRSLFEAFRAGEPEGRQRPDLRRLPGIDGARLLQPCGGSSRTCRRTSPGRQGAGPAPDPGDAPCASRGRPDLARTRLGQGARQGRTAQNRRRRRHRRHSSTARPCKDDEARGWYEALEFEPSPTDPYHLFLLMKDLRAMLSD